MSFVLAVEPSLGAGAVPCSSTNAVSGSPIGFGCSLKVKNATNKFAAAMYVRIRHCQLKALPKILRTAIASSVGNMLIDATEDRIRSNVADVMC